MTTHATNYKINERQALRTLLLATLVAGTLDITAAIIQFAIAGGEPIKIGYYIASGVFGRETAYGSGQWMALVGLFFHYVIVFIWSTFMFLVYPWIKSVLKNKILIGVLYGIFVWVIMNRVVVPLSNTPKRPFDLNNAIIGCLILIFCIGIPITLIVDRYYARRGV